MKKLLNLTAGALIGVMGVSCTTSYDAYGNSRQTVDPAGAAIGAIALGALAYSIGKSRGDRHEHHHHKSGRNGNNHGWGYNDYPRGRYCR